jgi:YesN/AraC family two-component response regulator
LLDGIKVDLLLADILMPGMSGITLAKTATKKQPGLRGILIIAKYIVRA